MSDTEIAIDPSDLMEQLLNDPTGAVRNASKERIEEIERNVKRALDGGVSPAEFQVLNKVLSALELAAVVVEDSWSLVQKSKKGSEK